MRILVLTQYFYPHTGGSQEYILQLYKAVQELDPAVAVDVICYNTDDAPIVEKIGSLTIYRISCIEILKNQFALPNYLELIQLVQKLKSKYSYDFVNSHTRFFDNSWYAPLIAKYLDAKSILTDHCANHPVHQNKIITSLVRLFDRVLLWLVPKLYDQVIAISKATKLLISQYNPQIKTVVQYAGIDPIFYQYTKKKDHKINITYIGRMISSKNPSLVISVAKQFVQDEKVYFSFAGDGPELTKLKQSAPKNCRFLGKLDRSEVAQLLTKTDILLHPSQHHEGLPITLLEAAASKTAIIATNTGGTEEIIKHGESGLLINPSEAAIIQAIKELLSQPKLRQQLAKNALKTSKEFSWQKTATEFIDLLKTV